MELTNEELVLTNGGTSKYIYITVLVYNLAKIVVKLIKYLR